MGAHAGGVLGSTMLSASSFPLGDTSLHLLHLPDGDFFVTADLATKVFDQTPASFADFVRANRYVRVNAMERSITSLCLSLGIPAETTGGDKASSGAITATTADDNALNSSQISASDAVTLLPEETVIAILTDRRMERLVKSFRDTAQRNAFEEASKLEAEGNYGDALPRALDAVKRAQEMYETPRAKIEEQSRKDAMKANEKTKKKSAGDDSGAITSTSSCPSSNLFEPYLQAARINLALGKTSASESLCGLASWISLRRGDEITELQRARLTKVRGDLRLKQSRKQDALTEFAKSAFQTAEAFGPQTPQVAVALFELAKAFRIKEEEGEAIENSNENDETDTSTSAARRCDAAAVKIWMAAAANEAGLLTSITEDTLEESSRFTKMCALSFSPESEIAFKVLTRKELHKAVTTLRDTSDIAAQEGDALGAGNALLAAGLVAHVIISREKEKENEKSESKDPGGSSESFDASFEPKQLLDEAVRAFPKDASDAAAFAKKVKGLVGI